MDKLIRNKRARFDNAITDTIKAGIVLHGSEVKSLRQGQASLKGSYINLKGDGAWLINANIGTYKNSSQVSTDNTRTRRLLVTKKQLTGLHAATQRGLQIVPLQILTAGNFIKVDIGIGRSQRHFDKREAIKTRDSNRQIRNQSDQVIHKHNRFG